MSEPAGNGWIGRPLKRREDHRLLTGAGSYVEFEENLILESADDGRTAIWGSIDDWQPPLSFHASWHPGSSAVWSTELRVAFRAVEDGTELRLVHSGLFDRFPSLTVVLGHLGETLPYFAWRIQHCFEFNPTDKRLERRLQDYLCDNFFVSTSGFFNDQALIGAVLTIGADRILFAVDYPYEPMEPATAWIERAPISEIDRRKIAHLNARAVFRLPSR